MKNFELISDDFECRPALAQIDEKKHLFGTRTLRQKYPGSAHADTETIFLRWAQHDTIESVMGSTSVVDQPEMKELNQTWPIIHRVLTAVEATELGRVILVKLCPGGQIIPHIDEGVYADKFERFHVVLQARDFRFWCGDESTLMHSGELWWFNHKKQHSAINASGDDRIDLIIDAVAPKYRREREAI